MAVRRTDGSGSPGGTGEDVPLNFYISLALAFGIEQFSNRLTSFNLYKVWPG